jgi:PAS domain S-box-containing protein
MAGTYDPLLVTFSIIIAIVASFTALTLVRRIANTSGLESRVWLITGSVSMGTGIWAMHFVGMLAFSLEIPFSHHIPTTVLSLFIGIGISTFAIHVGSRKQVSNKRVMVSGIFLGFGIALMHYTGFEAIRINAVIKYDYLWVIASIVVAVIAATLAICMSSSLNKVCYNRLLKLRLLASVVMGLAICGTHYTGMMATSYIRPIHPAAEVAPEQFTSWLAAALGFAAIVISGVINLTVFFNSKLSAERRHSEKAEERARRLTDILDESLHEVYVFDAQTLKILECNRGAAENLGLAANQIHALTPADINTEYDVDTFRNKLKPLLDGTKKEVRFDSVHRRVDGRTYPVNLHLQLFTKSMPHVFVGFIIDITERKNLERQILQSKKLESMGQLAAGIAHELNTPAQFVGDNIRFLSDSFEGLLALTNSCCALTDAVNDDNITPELLETIAQNAKSADLDYLTTEIPTAIEQSIEGVSRISKIVLAMKEFSHPGGESMDLVDLNKVISNTIVVASNEWKYVARLVTDLDPNLVDIRCFSHEISQVLLNLIVNSAHAITEKNGDPSDVLGEINISTRQTQRFVELRVKDTGAGIPYAIQEHVFDHFFTTKEVGKGTGQGLSMAYKTIVDQHGGEIKVESEENQGTTVVISLPFYQSEYCIAGFSK